MEKVYIYDGLQYDKNKIKKVILDSHVLDNVLPVDKVLIKPNFVQESRNQDSDWEYVITHPVLITAVLELLCNILKGGKIILADAPMTGSSFKKILEHMPVDEWKSICKAHHVPFEIIDLRDEEWLMAKNGVILKRIKQQGDPLGKVLANVKEQASEFYFKPATKQKLYGADYDIKETNEAHDGNNNYYSVSKSVINADVFINLPKLKTHKKAGITCCLKNLVGVNTNKNLLPHHTIGTPKDGGDQFASSSSSTAIESSMTMFAKNLVTRFKFLSPILVPLKKLAIWVWGDNKNTARSGGWYGNDTLWRTIIDLNKVVLYSDENGVLKEDNNKNRKRYIGIVDGILAGEGNGPVEPEIKEAGIIICGGNPVSIDCVAAKIMQFDYKKIPQIVNAFKSIKYRLISTKYEDIICSYNGEEKIIDDISFSYEKWKAPQGWVDHIEIES